MDVKLVTCAIRSGTWHGRAERADGALGPAPAFTAWHRGTRLADPDVTPVRGSPGSWDVRLPIPPEVLSGGVETLLIRDAETDETLESLAFASGDVLEEDLRAEIALLRAELDLLKRAFRRHCAESD